MREKDSYYYEKIFVVHFMILFCCGKITIYGFAGEYDIGIPYMKKRRNDSLAGTKRKRRNC